MTVQDFVTRLGEHFSAVRDIPTYLARISDLRLTGRELDKVWDALIDSHEYASCPRIAHVIAAAKSLGLPRPLPSSAVSTYTPTNCEFCAGSGLVACITLTQRLDSGATWSESLYGPYTLQPRHHGETSLARCICPAGADRYKHYPLWHVGFGRPFTPRQNTTPPTPEHPVPVATLHPAIQAGFGPSDTSPRRHWNDATGDVEGENGW
jgi:hypothetical protein